MSNFPHWPTRRTGDVFFVKGRIGWRNLRRSDFCEDGPHLITGMHIDGSGRVDWNSCFRIPRRKFDESPEIQVKVGDLVITKDGTIGKVARIDWLPGDTSLNAHLFLVRPIQTEICSARFAFHIFTSAAFRDFIENQKSGSTLAGLGEAKFVQFQFPLPTIKEQVLVSDVLDTIDTAIRETEALIDKLKAIKQGLLHDLLTRGIDANGQLRPPQSQAPQLYKESQLGWIPSEWEVLRLDTVAARGSGHTPSKNVFSYWNGGVKWVSLADSHRLDQIYIHETDKEISELGIANSSAVLHPEGTVILSRDAGIGKSAILGCNMAVSQHFMAWRCGEKLNNLFLYFYLQREKPKFEAIAMGSTIMTIGLPFFKCYDVALPPRREQDQATAILMETEQHLASHDAELEKLRQQKIGLMDDLLTGRVRVTPLLESVQKSAAPTEF